ncbi:MAG: preprotein translocase subunit SecE [Lentisphaeria bacterium]|nr:preprotein translocase subunit SecE [Lentisphaeria bacterium]NQZ68448.1 preprotein translocase subunit SecE [Lentisphaeria bacterium]
MSKVEQIKQYTRETLEEVRKCTWPNRPELIRQTILVLASTFLLAGFIYMSTRTSSKIIMWILELPK